MLWARIISLLLLQIGLTSGCMWASIERPIEAEVSPSLIQKVSDKEIVPASQQGVVTAAGYRVHSSVSFNSESSEVTTNAGYKVSMGVQSTLFEEAAK